MLSIKKELPFVSIITVTWNRKADLYRCLNSIKKIDYPNYEIIVVDNNSIDDTVKMIENEFIEVKLIKNEQNLGAAEGRNTGIKYAKGEFIFFLDSDNILHPNCLKELIEVISKDPSIGIVGPKMYYCDDVKRIWCTGVKINRITSKAIYRGYNEIDTGQYNHIVDVEHFPNAFLVRKSVIELVGHFDKMYFIMYEEADLCMKINNSGFRIVYVPYAKIWHNVPLFGKKSDILRRHGINSEKRAYLIARNRLIFMRKHASFYNYILFLFIFVPLFTLYYTLIIISSGKFIYLSSYLNGLSDGLFYKS